ncbi:hypothetical protein [Streptomyces sp. NPDC102462]|uniref:hypothetical protein n=1 Tax=Streptomyces sp. NPDC102462 TaxID=3366178 RepID=UPI0038187661
MGIKDQFQDKAKSMRDQAEQNMREKAGQRGQQKSGKPQSERGRQNPRDKQDTEREMHDRMDQDYDA